MARKSDQMVADPKTNELFKGELSLINVGLEGFAVDLIERNVRVVHVDWSPPGRGNPNLADLLSKLGS